MMAQNQDINYPKIKARKEDKAKSKATIIVLLNRTFSIPRLAKWPDPPSPPPKVPPTPASDLCNRIKTIRATDRIIWKKGSVFAIKFIFQHSSRLGSF